MPDSSLAESLLSLFTTPTGAASIAGDLIEESPQRGSLWFWSHIARTCVSFFLRGLAAEPIRIAALVLFGASLSQIALAVVAPSLMRLLGWNLNAPNLWIWLAGNILWGRLIAPFLVGLVIARFSPGREMTACGALAIAGQLVLISYWAWIASHRQPSPFAPYFLVINMIPALLLLSAGALVRKSCAQSAAT